MLLITFIISAPVLIPQERNYSGPCSNTIRFTSWIMLSFFIQFASICVVLSYFQLLSLNVEKQNCIVIFFRINAYRTFQLTSYPIFLCLPVVGVTIMCGVVMYLVRKRAKMNLGSKKDAKLLRKEKQAEFQLILIIAAFLLGYIPFLGKV